MNLFTHGKFATTVLLVVELVFLEQLIAAFVQTTLAPVLCPKGDTFNLLFSCMTGTFYLFKAFPSGRGQSGSKILNVQFFGHLGCCCQTQGETLLATMTTLRFPLQTIDASKPRLVVVVTINPLQSETIRMTLALVLAYLILLTRIDIGIEIEDDRFYAVGQQPLYNG